jgi:hypothetical protein
MATSKISSDSPADYSIPPEQFLVKLRKNLDGVALSHDALDNNWEVIRRTLNDLIEEVDEITGGALSSTTTENLYVNKIADDVIGSSHIKDGAIIASKIPDGSIVTAKIQSQSITSDLIADGSINSDKIASDSPLDFSNGISVNDVQVVDSAGNITGPVSLSDAQKVELKGEPGKDFTYGDFTENQLQLLKGEPFTYDDFTQSQLDGLKGDKGEPGLSPTFQFNNGTLTITNV